MTVSSVKFDVRAEHRGEGAPGSAAAAHRRAAPGLVPVRTAADARRRFTPQTPPPHGGDLKTTFGLVLPHTWLTTSSKRCTFLCDYSSRLWVCLAPDRLAVLAS